MGKLSGKDKGDLLEAILAICPTHDELKMFIIKDVDCGLQVNDHDRIKLAIFKLIEESERTGVLEQLIIGLHDYDDVVNRKDIQARCNQLLQKLQPEPLVKIRSSLTLDFDRLFHLFNDADLRCLQCAFHEAYQLVYDRSYYRARPLSTEMDSLEDIQELLECYGTDEQSGPVLAVRFVEYAIAELKCAEHRAQFPGKRDFFRELNHWRQQTAKTFNVDSSPLNTDLRRSRRRGYLLVTFQVLNDEIADINLAAELYRGETLLCGQPEQPRTSRTLDDVAVCLSGWIRSAQDKLSQLGCGQVCIELFLPMSLIESVADVADTWQIQDLQQTHYVDFRSEDFVLRSLDRVIGPGSNVLQRKLLDNWQVLERCRREPACNHFYIQAQPPQVSDFNNLEVPGLSVTGNLPVKVEERRKLVAAIINSGVPISVWFGAKNQQPPAVRLGQLQQALGQNFTMTEFWQWARVWRNLRAQDNVRLLVDCPYRLPTLPDPEHQAEDALYTETLPPTAI